MQDQRESESPSSTPDAPVAPSLLQEKRLSAWWVLGSIFGLSLLLGVLAHHRLIHSVTSIKGSMQTFQQRGQTRTPEQCARAVLKWAQKCGAMQSLCDASVHRLMGQCLESQSRQKACMEMDLKHSKAHFTFARCKAHKLHRHPRWKKVCGGIYSSLWIHCMYWRTGKLKKIPPSAKRTHATPATSMPSNRKGK